MADEELELDVNEPEGKSKKMIMIIVVAILLLNGIGVGAWMFLSGDGDDKTSDETAESVLEPLNYLTMVPEFIVNFAPGSKVRYLQVDLQIATREKDSLDMISTYRPVLRNNILIVLSDVNYNDLKDRAGKEALQKRLLNTINKALVEATQTTKDDDKNSDEKVSDEKVSDGLATEEIKGPIENVYYTSFIMQ